MRATFANLVSGGPQEVTLPVHIERPIQTASMAAENVTSLSAVCFTFEVDPDVIPALPFVAHFYYGDASEEVVPLGETHSGLTGIPKPNLYEYVL